jgi:hypothetical protein
MHFRDGLDDREWKEKRRYDLTKVANKACRLSEFPARWFVKHPANIALGQAAWERTAKTMKQSRRKEMAQIKKAREEAAAAAETEEDAKVRAARQRKAVRRMSTCLPDHWDEDIREETANAKHEDVLEAAKVQSEAEGFAGVKRRNTNTNIPSKIAAAVAPIPVRRDDGLPYVCVTNRCPDSLSLSLSNVGGKKDVQTHAWPSTATVLGGWNAFAEAVEIGTLVKVEVQYRLRGRDNWESQQITPVQNIPHNKLKRRSTDGRMAIGPKQTMSPKGSFLSKSGSMGMQRSCNTQAFARMGSNIRIFGTAGVGTGVNDTVSRNPDVVYNLTTTIERNTYNTLEQAESQTNMIHLKGLSPSAWYEVRARYLTTDENGSTWSPFSQVLVSSTTEHTEALTCVNVGDMERYSLFDSQECEMRSGGACGRVVEQSDRQHVSSLGSEVLFGASSLASAEAIDVVIAHNWMEDKLATEDYARMKLQKCKEYEEQNGTQGVQMRYWLDTGCIAPDNVEEGMNVLPGVINKSKKMLVLLSESSTNELWWLYSVACFYALKSEASVEVKLVSDDPTTIDADGRPAWTVEQRTLLESVRNSIDDLALADEISIGTMPRAGAHIDCRCATKDWQKLLVLAGAIFGSVKRFQTLLQTSVLPSLYADHAATDAPGKPRLELVEVQQARGGLWERTAVREANRPQLQLMLTWATPACSRAKKLFVKEFELEYQHGRNGEWMFLASTRSLAYKIKVRALLALFAENGDDSWDATDSEEGDDANVSRLENSFHVRVRARFNEDPSDESGCGMHSLAAPISRAPPSVSAFTTGLISSSSIEIRWAHPKYRHGVIKGYRVKWREADHADEDASSTEVGAGSVVETIACLRPGIKYIVSVAAFGTDDGPFIDMEISTRLSEVQERKRKATQAMQQNARRMRRQSMEDLEAKKEAKQQQEEKQKQKAVNLTKRRNSLAAQFKIGVSLKMKAAAAHNKIEQAKSKSTNAKLLAAMTADSSSKKSTGTRKKSAAKGVGNSVDYGKEKDRKPKKSAGRSKSFAAIEDCSLADLHLRPKETKRVKNKRKSVNSSDFDVIRKQLAEQRAGVKAAAEVNDVLKESELGFLDYLVKRQVISEVDMNALLEIVADGKAEQVSNMLTLLEEEILQDPTRDWPAIISDTMQAVGEGWKPPEEDGEDNDRRQKSVQPQPYIGDAIQRSKEKSAKEKRRKAKGRTLTRGKTSGGKALSKNADER